MSSCQTAGVEPATTLAERVEQLTAVFAEQQNVIDQGCGVLQNMSSQFEALQQKYAPVRDDSVRLTRIQEHANETYQAIKKLLEDLQLHHKVEYVMRQRSPERRLDELLALLVELNKSTEYFSSRRGLGVAEHAISVNRERAHEAYERCGALFCALLSAHMVTPGEGELQTILKMDLADRPPAEKVLTNKAAALEDLRKLAAAMIDGGEHACVDQYVAARRQAVQSMMQCMGMQAAPQSPGGPAAPVVDPERRAKEWANSMRMLAQLLDWESQLAAALLPEAVQAAALNRVLIGAVESTVATGHQLISGRLQPERLFLVLDLIACMRAPNVMPAMKKALNRPALVPLKDNFNGLLSTLNTVAKQLADAFLDDVANNPSVLPKDVSEATTVAPQTAVALRFLKHLFKEEFADHLTFLDDRRGFATAATRALLLSLQAKVTPGVKDPAAAALTMMNNVNYLITGVSDHSALRGVLGEAWLEHQQLARKRWRQEYFTHAWEALLGVVQEACADASPTVKKEAAKEYFKKINTRLDKVQSSQKLWSIPDANLRRQVRQDILGSLMPGYTHFWNSYEPLQLFKNPQKHLRYTPDALVAIVNGELFAGSKAGVKSLDASPVMKAFGSMNLNTKS